MMDLLTVMGGILGLIIIIGIIAFVSNNETALVITGIFVVGLVVFLAPNSEEREARRAENEKQKAEQSVPVLIQEKDGCKIYRFYDYKSSSSARHFTKCENTTETTWKESCGKSCTKDMNIVTSN